MDDDRVDGYKSIPMANAIAADESKKSRRPENSLIVRGSMGSLLVSLYTSRTWTKLYRSSLPDQVSLLFEESSKQSSRILGGVGQGG